MRTGATGKSLRGSVRVALVPIALGLSACATYGFAARGPPPDRQTVAIDRANPQSSVQWSFFWGLKSTLWSPLTCTEEDAQGHCVATTEPCDGHGVGQFEAHLTWYSVPLALVTLGTAIPSRLTVYCSTQEAPGSGP
jgi:hypothetical protein